MNDGPRLLLCIAQICARLRDDRPQRDREGIERRCGDRQGAILPGRWLHVGVDMVTSSIALSLVPVAQRPDGGDRVRSNLVAGRRP